MMTSRILLSLVFLAAPALAHADDATTSKVASWVKSGCQYLTTNYRIAPSEAAPHFGRVLRIQQVNPNDTRIYFETEALPGWETSIENGTIVTITVPNSVTISIGDLERHFGPAKVQVGDYQLRRNISKVDRSRPRKSVPGTFEFPRIGEQHLCLVIIHTLGDPAEYRSQRVLKIEFVD